MNIVINDHPFSVSLDSVDKNTIIATARKLCITHAAALNIRPDEVENGCVNAVADHIFRDVFSGDLKEYPVTVSTFAPFVLFNACGRLPFPLPMWGCSIFNLIC